MAQFEQWFDQDFTEKIEIRHCESVMFTGDDKGAVVGVRLFGNGAAYSGGGTVSGAVKRSDGGLVALTGTLSGNAASVVIPAAALAVAGPIGVRIVLNQGGSVTTVLKAIYSVDDNSGVAVDPGTIIPNVNDLITAINTAVASIPSDYSALLHTLAPDFSASTAYSAGDYVWYNGVLYRFAKAHEAGTWASTDAVATVVGKEFSYFRVATDAIIESIANSTGTAFGDELIPFRSGYYRIFNSDTGAYSDSVNYVCCKAACTGGDVFHVHVYGRLNGITRPWAFYDASWNELSVSTTAEYNGTLTAPQNAAYALFNNELASLPTGYYVYKGSTISTLLSEAFVNKGSAPKTLTTCDDVRGNSIMFITQSGGVPKVPDFPIAGAGWLWTITTASQSMQIAFPWVGDQTIKYRTRRGGTWYAWVDFSGGGEQITNEFNFYTNQNTYNITSSPTITTDTNNYLASTGDTTDRTAAIAAMLQSTGICRLGPGNFYVKDLKMPASTAIIGSGVSTVVQMVRGSDGCAIQLNSGCMVKDLMVNGADSDPVTSTVGGRHGLLWAGRYQEGGSNPLRGMIDNVYIKNFSGGGIACYNTGIASYACLMVSNAYVYTCWAGVYIAYSSEYGKFTNVRCNDCYVGCLNNGGNNVFVNCDFSSNREYAMLMDNSTEAMGNNGHGSCVGCVFNHTQSGGSSNSGVGVKMIKINNGFIFDGCQMFYSRIELEDTIGAVFSNCNFGSSNNSVSISGGGAIVFANNLYGTAPTINITGNNNVHFVNCYVRNTGAAVAP